MEARAREEEEGQVLLKKQRKFRKKVSLFQLKVEVHRKASENSRKELNKKQENMEKNLEAIKVVIRGKKETFKKIEQKHLSPKKI